MLGEYLFPEFLSRPYGNACVDDPPAIVVLEQIQIDMVQGHGQWHAQPQHPGHYLPDLARPGNVVKQVFEHSARPL